MGQFHLGRRNRMCEDLEVFNSILMVVFSFRLGQSTGSGQKCRGKKNWTVVRGQVRGALCANKQRCWHNNIPKAKVRWGREHKDRSEVPYLSVCLPTGSVTCRGPWWLLSRTLALVYLIWFGASSPPHPNMWGSALPMIFFERGCNAQSGASQRLREAATTSNIWIFWFI